MESSQALQIPQYIAESPSVSWEEEFRKAREYVNEAILRSKEAFWLYWRAGNCLWRANRSYGEKTVSRFAEWAGYSESYVRDWMRLATLDESQMTRLMDAIPRPTWGKLLSEISEKRRLEGSVEDTDETGKNLIRRIEGMKSRLHDAVEDLERFHARRQGVLDESLSEEVDGVILDVHHDLEWTENVVSRPFPNGWDERIEEAFKQCWERRETDHQEIGQQVEGQWFYPKFGDQTLSRMLRILRVLGGEVS